MNGNSAILEIFSNQYIGFTTHYIKYILNRPIQPDVDTDADADADATAIFDISFLRI